MLLDSKGKLKGEFIKNISGFVPLMREFNVNQLPNNNFPVAANINQFQFGALADAQLSNDEDDEQADNGIDAYDFL